MIEPVRITVTSGRVQIIGESRAGIDVSGAETSGSGTELSVRGKSKPVTVRVPTGTDVFVGSNSGNVELSGLLGNVSVTTRSADITAEEVASIDARTNSGKLTVGESHGSVRLRSKSSRSRVRRAGGNVHITTTSGRVEVQDARDAVSIKNVSGDTDVTVTGTGEVSVEAMSGDITVYVPADSRPDVQLRTTSGKKRIECETGTDFVITGRSMSGDITVTPA
jgi:DUF4097 and DUF4098 domain-containing protein YvlB